MMATPRTSLYGPAVLHLPLALAAVLCAPEPSPVPEPSLEPEPSPAPAPSLEPVPSPAPAPTPTASSPAEPEAPAYELRTGEDMPYAPTPARLSANLRGNEVLVRPFRAPVFSAAAAARFGVLLAGGRDVVQPYGYGFAAQLRAHFARVYKSRFGLELHAGHTRFPERQAFESPLLEGLSVRRDKLLTATDVSLGPSLEIPIGPLFVQFGAGVGVGISSLLRPVSADPIDDEGVTAVNPLVRGGLSFGVPVFEGHGLTLGVGAQHIFSPREVPIVVDDPEGEQTRPFSSSLEVFAGYSIWF